MEIDKLSMQLQSMQNKKALDSMGGSGRDVRTAQDKCALSARKDWTMSVAEVEE